jgi:putative FmdB family regulatory protein
LPIHIYKCLKCENEFEELVLSVDEGAPTCPECQSPECDRIPNTFGGYGIRGNNSASVRPKGAGSRIKGSKK